MKRLNHLWEPIITFDNLLLAYKKARMLMILLYLMMIKIAYMIFDNLSKNT